LTDVALLVHRPVSWADAVDFRAEPTGRVSDVLVEQSVAILFPNVSITLVVENRVDRRFGRMEKNGVPCLPRVKPRFRQF
jgi:hypothetical protein